MFTNYILSFSFSYDDDFKKSREKIRNKLSHLNSLHKEAVARLRMLWNISWRPIWKLLEKKLLPFEPPSLCRNLVLTLLDFLGLFQLDWVFDIRVVIERTLPPYGNNFQDIPYSFLRAFLTTNIFVNDSFLNVFNLQGEELINVDSFRVTSSRFKPETNLTHNF